MESLPDCVFSLQKWGFQGQVSTCPMGSHLCSEWKGSCSICLGLMQSLVLQIELGSTLQKAICNYKWIVRLLGCVFITGQKHCSRLYFACRSLGARKQAVEGLGVEERGKDRNKEVLCVPHPHYKGRPGFSTISSIYFHFWSRFNVTIITFCQPVVQIMGVWIWDFKILSSSLPSDPRWGHSRWVMPQSPSSAMRSYPISAAKSSSGTT